jgi:transcriptional regulator with XRE-family HTH domain
MKIGENIREVREAQGKKPEALAAALKISVEEYLNLENEVTDITVKQLITISNALSISPVDLLEVEEAFGQIKNYFYNQAENKGTNINVQGIDQEEIRKAYKELYAEEFNRIPKLEKILRENNIAYNF